MVNGGSKKQSDASVFQAGKPAIESLARSSKGSLATAEFFANGSIHWFSIRTDG
jgi:hypothetical protein